MAEMTQMEIAMKAKDIAATVAVDLQALLDHHGLTSVQGGEAFAVGMGCAQAMFSACAQIGLSLRVKREDFLNMAGQEYDALLKASGG